VRGLSRVLSVPAALTGRRLVLAIAAVVAVVAGAGGTALALTTPAPSHALSMSRGDLTRAALKVTAGTPFLDVSMGRPGGTLLRVSTPDGVTWALDLAGGTQRTVADLRGGTVLTPPGWATATSRIDLDATSGFSQLTVSRWSPAGS
jgi:hypothetical protein